MTGISPQHFALAHLYRRGKRLLGDHYLHFCIKLKNPHIDYQIFDIDKSEKQVVILAVSKSTHMKRIQARLELAKLGHPAPDGTPPDVMMRRMPRHLSAIEKLTPEEYIGLYEVMLNWCAKNEIQPTILRSEPCYSEISVEELPQLLFKEES